MGPFRIAERFGFNADVANGFFTPAPTLILYAAYTVGIPPRLPLPAFSGSCCSGSGLT